MPTSEKSIGSGAPFVNDVVVIDGPDINHPSTPFIRTLLTNAVGKYATDIHLRPRSAGPVQYRSKGQLLPAKEWMNADGSGKFTDEKGRLIDHGAYDDCVEALTRDGKGCSTVVYRLAVPLNHQVRIERVSTSYGQKLFVRVQPRVPPAITETFQMSPGTVDFLSHGKGLVLVCGELGKGKTTLSSAISAHWASLGRHVFCAEDPVEYIIDTQDRGEFSYVNCRFLTEPGSREDNRPTLSQIIPWSLRSDIDALQLGEVRTAEPLTTALEIANSGKPVITTFHAGSIGNAITRIFSMASRVLGPDVAKLTLAQALHAALYVSLAYDSKGKPIPLVMCLPIAGQALRRTIATANPETLALQIDNTLSTGKSVPGTITREQAISNARNFGATPDSISAALPAVADFLTQN